MSPTWRNAIAAFVLGVGVQWVSDAVWWQQFLVVVAVVGAYFWVQFAVEAEARRLGRLDGLREARHVALGLRGHR